MKKAFGCVFAVCLLSGTAAWGTTVGGGDVTFTIPGGRTAVFSHDLHVMKSRLGCSDCHFRLFNTSPGYRVRMMMADMANGRSCGACHNGDLAFSVKQNCSKCHTQAEGVK